MDHLSLSDPTSCAASGGRVLLAMSGGVDSSVAAAMLVEQGYEVVGATMKTFCYSGTEGAEKSCCGLDGIRDAKSVARRLGIEHHVFDVEEEFRRDVIDDFVSEYAEGRTPNPCVRCNSNTKFRDLLRRGHALGCDQIASGHYARVATIDGETALLRGVDEQKDQTYFLWGISDDILRRLVLPLGDLTKPEVRARARELGLTTADKPESQEICFVPEGSYRDFLADRLMPGHAALTPGPIEDSSGNKIGTHDGFAGFTVGQRKRLGGGFGRPLFVLGIRAADRAVVVGAREELEATGVVVGETHWLTQNPPVPGETVGVRVRHRAVIVPGQLVDAATDLERVEPQPETQQPSDGTQSGMSWATTSGADTVHLTFETPQCAITPGQSAVFYRGDRVLGGGRIRASHSPVSALQPG